jgi:hypothetical protein
MSKSSKLYYSSLLLPFFSLPSFAIDAIEKGSASVDFRYRYETVDQDNIANTAHASTLRSRFNFTTAVQSDFQSQIEVDNVAVIGGDNHNDSHNGLTDHLSPQYQLVEKMLHLYFHRSLGRETRNH